MEKQIKRWNVSYSHDDGRTGTVEVTTEVAKSQRFQYGNGKYGILIVGDLKEAHDLRYCKEKDLHMVMLKSYFGKGLVKATEI